MGARDAVVGVLLGPPGHVANAKPANVVVAARGHEDRVEVAQADRAVVLEHLALDGVVGWVVVSNMHVLFVDLSLDSHFVALAYFSLLRSSQSQAPLFALPFFQVLFFAGLAVHATVLTNHVAAAVGLLEHSLRTKRVLGAADLRTRFDQKVAL